jgi:hypothetical protein
MRPRNLDGPEDEWADRDPETWLPESPLDLVEHRREQWLTDADVWTSGRQADELAMSRWLAARAEELRELVKLVPPHLWSWDPERWDFGTWKLAREAFSVQHGWPDGRLAMIRQQYRTRRGEPYEVGQW